MTDQANSCELPDFYIVDVFAEDKYTGNQVAVVKYSGKLSDKEMQHIAKELYFSETSFVLSDIQPNGGYDVRIFTPREEVPYSGHATIGTACVINRHFSNGPQKQVILNLKAGSIPVEIESRDDKEEVLWMEQIQPKFNRIYEPVLLSKILGIEPEDIDTSYPIQEITTGLPFLIVPLKPSANIKDIEFNKERYYWLVKKIEAKCILIFTTKTYKLENQVNVRVFADYYGIPEDPASGSGSGCLGAYMSKYKVLGDQNVNIRVEQGYEIGRQALLFVKVTSKGDSMKISVGGRVITVAKGQLL